jgi:hypothetical protein
MKQQGCKHLEFKATIAIVSDQMLSKERFDGTQGNGGCFHVQCLVDLFFHQHVSLFHSFFTLTISNKVQMDTKVNCWF